MGASRENSKHRIMISMECVEHVQLAVGVEMSAVNHANLT